MSDHVLLTRPRLAARYDRSVPTIRRWERQGIIPAPDGYIIDEPYWRPETVATIDRNLNNATAGSRSAGHIQRSGNAL